MNPRENGILNSAPYVVRVFCLNGIFICRFSQ